MFSDIASAYPANYPIFGSKASRAHSFLAPYMAHPLTDGKSIQARIGAIFEDGFSRAVTGFMRKEHALIVTVDGNPAEFRNIVSIIQPTSTAAAKTTVINFKAQIKNVQDKLGLSITQLAQLFGVTRKTVYDWLDDAEPRANISNRMNFLADLLKRNDSKLDLKRLKGVWLMVVNGQSFIDVVLDEELDRDSRMTAALEKLDELAPRLGQSTPKLSKTYLGNAHTSDIERVAYLG